MVPVRCSAVCRHFGTQLKERATLGIEPVLLMVGVTVFLVALAVALLLWFG